MQPGRARSFELPHRAQHVERISISRVGVADHGDLDAAGDRARVLDHLVHREQSDVRTAPRRRGAEAGHVDRLEARGLGDLRLQTVVDEGGQDHPVAPEKLSQSRRRRAHPVFLPLRATGIIVRWLMWIE